MKKVISLFVCLIMIAAMAVSSVSAAGQILFKDEFNSMDNNDWIWDPEATLSWLITAYSRATTPPAFIRPSTVPTTTEFVFGIISAARSM